MRHFFTRNTVESKIWCVKCHKDTFHAISGGRPQFCQVCQSKPQHESMKPDKPATSGNLFGDNL